MAQSNWADRDDRQRSVACETPLTVSWGPPARNENILSGGPQLRSIALATLVVALLAGLPIAIWLDLHDLTEAAVRRQAADLNSVITSIRSYYATNVVGRILGSHGSTTVLPNYEDVPGAVPVPATLSIELGRVIGEHQSNSTYRFVSDLPFKNRTPHVLDSFERETLTALRQKSDQQFTEVSTSLFRDRVRHIVPIVMGPTCVGCHNSEPNSPKRDWKVGDVRGIQELSVTQPIAANIFSFRYLLVYLALAGASGVAFIAMQSRLAALIRSMNNELERQHQIDRNHLDWLRQLASFLRHEVRQPVAQINSSIELIQLTASEGRLGPHIAAASQSARDVWNLVERASRATDAEAFVRQSQLQSIDLWWLLDELVRSQQQTYSGIHLDLKGSESAFAQVDPTLLKEAVTNLVANAVSFAVEQSTIEILLEQTGGSVIIKVCNKGPLLLCDPEVLFGPFASTRSGPSSEHQGLGLYLVRLIAEHHGGSAAIANMDDQSGVEASIRLPLAG
jgi:signal transduction histidine kinase